MEIPRYIALTDAEGLRIAGVPYTRTYLYKVRSQNKPPLNRTLVKVAGKLLFDVEEFYRLIERDRRKRQNEINKICQADSEGKQSNK